MGSQHAFVPQDLSDLIGAIYDCALEPDRWHTTIRAIADLFASPICNLGINNMQDAGFRRVFLGIETPVEESLVEAQITHQPVGAFLPVLARNLGEDQARSVAVVAAAKPNLNLEQLAANRVYEFVFTAAPLKIRGGTGSPIRPLALVR